MKSNFLNKEFVLGSVAIIFGVIATSVLLWVLIKYPTENFPGERFVSNRFLFGHSPMSIIIFSAFICFMSALESLRSYLTNVPAIIKILLFISFCFLAFVYSYEVIWQFFAWSEAYALSDGNVYIDMLHILPNQESGNMAHNFTFRTKEVFFYTTVGLYGAYFFNGIMRIDKTVKIDKTVNKNSK